MKALLAMAWRGILDMRFVLIVAALGAAVPLLLPWLPRLQEEDPSSVRVLAGLTSAGVVEVLIGVFLGASLFSVTRPGHRLGFDLSRPVGIFALWSARTATAMATAMVCGALVAAPALWIAAPTWREIAYRVPLLLVMGIASVPLGHFCGLAYRSRSALALVDIAAILGGCLAFGWIYWETFASAGTWMSLRERSWAVSGVFDLDTLVCGACGISALLAASAAATVRGRLDLHAARRSASLALWAALLTNIVLVALHMVWVLTPTPANLVDVLQVKPAPRGNWALVEGIARAEAHSRFLIDLSSGKWERISVDAWSVFSDEFSPSGSKAVVANLRDNGHRRISLSSLDFTFRAVTLSDEGADLRSIEVAEQKMPANRTQWSPEETRLVRASTGFWIRAYDFPEGHLLCELPVTTHSLGRMTRFIGEDTVRLANDYTPDCSSPGCVTDTPRQIEIVDLDVETCSTSVVGEITGLRAISHINIWADPGGQRMVVVAGEQATLHDERGGLLATLLDEPNRLSARVGFIGDGRFVMSTRRDRTIQLHVYSRDGELEQTIDLPDGEFLRMGCEVAPSVLLMAVAPREHDWHLAQLLTVDLNEGAIKQIGEGMVPALVLPGLAVGSPASVPEPGAPGTLLCLRTSESAGPRSTMVQQQGSGPYRASLVRIDPETGEQEVILGR